jgi:hypothetical protein
MSRYPQPCNENQGAEATIAMLSKLQHARLLARQTDGG